MVTMNMQKYYNSIYQNILDSAQSAATSAAPATNNANLSMITALKLSPLIQTIFLLLVLVT